MTFDLYWPDNNNLLLIVNILHHHYQSGQRESVYA